MHNKKDRIYSFRQLVPEIIDMTEEHKAFDADQKKIQRYYSGYKRIEYFRDRYIGKDNNIYEEDKDMVVENMRKIWNDDDYIKFVNQGNRKKFEIEDFLKMMEDDKNQEIFKELYLDNLYTLDYDYYETDKDEVDAYIDKIYSRDVNEKYSEVLESLDLIHTSLGLIRDVDIKKYLLGEVDEALKKVSIEIVEYVNQEHYMQRIMYHIPQLRFKTKIHELPDDLFEEYAKINGYRNLFESEVTQNGYQIDKISDEVLEEIVDEYYKNLEKINKEKAEIMDKIEAIFD